MEFSNLWQKLCFSQSIEYSLYRQHLHLHFHVESFKSSLPLSRLSSTTVCRVTVDFSFSSTRQVIKLISFDSPKRHRSKIITRQVGEIQTWYNAEIVFPKWRRRALRTQKGFASLNSLWIDMVENKFERILFR